MTDIAKQLDDLVDEPKKPKVEQIQKYFLEYRDKEQKHLKKSNANLIALFKGADGNLIDLFRYNETTKQVEIMQDRLLPNQTKLDQGKLDDKQLVLLWGYLSERWGLDFRTDDIYRAVYLVALNESYNPITEFLEASKRDCIEQDPFPILLKYINLEDNDYNRLVFQLIFKGAIARVFNPGIQFDYCLDLVGKQGTGKTTFLREIFKGFSGEISTFTDKDDLLKMLELWAVNDDELVASSKISFNDLKQRITQREIMVRRPYGKSIERIPVDFIFTRTTNDTGHLKDATGDRRFVPVEVLARKPNQKNEISQSDLRDIWGNYFRLYEADPKLYYDDKSKEGKIISQGRERYKVQDDIFERLEWYLEIPIPADFYDVKIADYMRQNYYYYLEEVGAGYRTKADLEEDREWLGDAERDRISQKKVISEIFSNEHDPKLKSKIKLFMNNRDGWEYKKNLKFGKGQASGWKRLEK